MYWLQFQTRVRKDVTEGENLENVKLRILEAMVKGYNVNWRLCIKGH